MTTLEKLFVQIFERKNRIIEQVEQQSDLYTRHLVSKLLIDGITPPSWLWNPKFDSETSDRKELNKEELISEILLPHPRPAVSYSGTHCPLYNKPIVIGDNGELSEGLFMETHASNMGFNTGDRPTTMPECHDNDIGCALNCVPELDFSATSPQGQIEVKMSNICTAPDQSLARIQRSKSRQKALELRKSAKATPKSRFTDENDTGVSSRIASQQLDRDNEVLEVAKFSDTISDNHAVRHAKGKCLSKEKDANIYCGRITRFRSSSNLSSHDSKPLKPLSSSDIAKEDGARMTRPQSTCIEGVSKPAHLSNTASQRVTRSKSGASKRSLLANSSNRLEGLVLQNESGGDVIPRCATDAIANQEGKADYVTESEHILDEPVETQATCSDSNLDDAGLSVGLEAIVLRPPSDCSMFVKPKVLDFDDVEKCSLNETFNPMLEKERLDKSSGKRFTSVKSTASLDKVTFVDPYRKSLEKQSLEQEVSNKRAEAWRVSFETYVEGCVEVDQEVSQSDINKNLKNVEDNSDAVLEIQHSPFSRGADVSLLYVDKGPGVEMHQKVTCHIVEGFEFSPRLQVEEGELCCDGRDISETIPFTTKDQQLGPSPVSSLTKHSAGDQGCLVGEVGMTDPSIAVLDNLDLMCVENKLDEGRMSGLACSERTLLERKPHVGEDGSLACGSVGSLHSEDKNFSSSKIRELQLLEGSFQPRRRFRSAAEDSWPQFKQRKIEGQQTNFFSASPSFKVKEVHGMGGHTTNRYVKSIGDNLETLLQIQCFPVSHEGDAAQSNAGKSPDVELNQKVNYHLTQGIEPSPELQLEQEESTSKHGQLGPSLVPSLTKEAAGDSHGCFIENAGPADTTSIVLDVRKQCDEQNYKNLRHSETNSAMENKDDLTHTEGIQQETKPHFEEDGLFSYCSVESPQDKHPCIGADQTLPEFEGFIVDTEENERSHIVGDAISLDKLDLPNTTIERASVLEQLCKSASMHTPMSEFSTTFKLHRTLDLYQSVPNGLLEHMDLGSSLNLNNDSGKQLRASYSCVDEVKCAFQGVSSSDCVPYADARFDYSLKKPYMSPVGKLWDRISSNSSSSEKQRSLNPELTCFPIEEDPSISGENENIDEVADTTQEDMCSTLMTCAKREPLAEITEACVNPPTSVSAAERFPERSRLDSINTEVSFTGMQSRVKQKLGNHRYSNKRRCTNEAKENRSLSVSTNCIKRTTESLNSRFSKPKLSGKNSLRKGGQNLLDRESKRNNIVSNITSFLPLVQQKQAAAVGKRDIKVKALEAAEAAKRLEEKRQHERKMKKDALKLERERKEQENLQQMELNKKKKEEEQKKKDANMAARKRLREEEERKEKERKRKRIEEPRQQQRGQEEKLRIGKEKEIPFSAIDEKVNNGKESNNELRKHQKMKKPETDPRPAEISTSNVRQVILEDCEAFSQCGDNGEPTSVFTKTTEKDDFMAKTSIEKSYEISPYQCSDDEEEEEDEIRTKKFIPSWASKNSVALVLSSQQNVDPYIIFPPESFCSMDEVLQPRKLQLK